VMCPSSSPAKKVFRQTHKCLTFAVVECCQKMEGIELTLQSVILRRLIHFMTSVSAPFSDCLK
jgi:hypothetical protein